MPAVLTPSTTRLVLYWTYLVLRLPAAALHRMAALLRALLVFYRQAAAAGSIEEVPLASIIPRAANTRTRRIVLGHVSSAAASATHTAPPAAHCTRRPSQATLPRTGRVRISSVCL